MSSIVYNELLGKVIIKIDKIEKTTKLNDLIRFYLSNGDIYEQYHEDDCSENVYIEDINGDLNNLVGYELLQAEESTLIDTNASESATWTFYKFATIKGYVTIRWYGESNGYYCETARLIKTENKTPIKMLRDFKLKKLNKKRELI